MNKKFSTLVAALMAAGALVLPADMFAQIRYAGGQNYDGIASEVKQFSTAEAGEEGEYFIVFNEGGTDYVAVVTDGHALEAKAFAEASMADFATVTKTESGITFATGENLLGFHNKQNKWGTNTTLSEVYLGYSTGEYLWIHNGSKSVTWADGKFSVAGNTSATPIAKAVPVSALEAIVDNSETYGFVAAKEILSTSQNYIIWENGKALTNASEDGKATWAAYISGQNQYWTIEIVDNGNNTGVAKFKNDGDYLQDANGNHITANVTKTADGWKFANNNAIELSAKIGGWNTVALGAVNQYGNTLSSADLASINGSSFGIQIVDANDKALETTSNPFTGNLKPVQWVNGNFKTEKVVADESYNPFVMLQNAEGNILVVDTKDPYASADGSNSYKVTTITPSALAHALADDDATVSGRYYYQFLFYTADDFVVGKSQNVTSIDVVKNNGTSYDVVATIGALDSNGKKLLTAALNGTPNNPIKITIGKFNTIDVAKLLGTSPKFFTVTGKNTKKVGRTYGQVLGLDQNGFINYVDTKDALVGYPETQWAITYDAEANTLILKNREKPDAGDYNNPVGKTINVSELYYVDNSTNLFALNGDTIAIEPVASYKESDGFLRLDADQLRDQVYNVGASSAVYDAVGYFAENHANSHQIGMTTDKDASTEWNVIPLMARDADALGHTTKVYPDTIAIESVLGYFKADGTYKETNKDDKNQVFLKVTAYTLQNSENKEYIGYNDSRYALGYKDNRKGYEAPQRFFVFKDNGDEKYNLVEVEKVTSDAPYRNSRVAQYNADDEAYYSIEDLSLNPYAKMYSGDGTENGILNNTPAYNQEENDLFVVEPRDAAMYKKLAMGDTISLYREVDDQDILFENGQFLGTATSDQFAEANPALYVDTAYVDRGNNNRWEYLLAVEAKHWESNLECNIPGHPKHKADTTTGRFLVSLMDSAYVYAEEHLHNNIFINEVDGEDFAKLGFVEGYHTHDTLYLQRPDGTYDKIDMTRKEASHSIGKFAFRFIDNTENAFVIETGSKFFGYGNEVKPGYLKWLNGTIVVVDDIEKAEVFNMNTDETRTPTANEEIAAEATVSVVATDGAVIVKGAEGKNVVVSTILGKVVANEVLNSDNETIAAPAGIVVVSVDGESFKVAVK